MNVAVVFDDCICGVRMHADCAGTPNGPAVFDECGVVMVRKDLTVMEIHF